MTLGVTGARRPLVTGMFVRIKQSRFLPSSSTGLGLQPFKLEKRVRPSLKALSQMFFEGPSFNWEDVAFAKRKFWSSNLHGSIFALVIYRLGCQPFKLKKRDRPPSRAQGKAVVYWQD